ncbi:Uncharacterized protein Rs2_16156 [Raphanus sativus]|nr:Uncharacterized protein Rs2_16156 [Raphanus sativus]
MEKLRVVDGGEASWWLWFDSWWQMETGEASGGRARQQQREWSIGGCCEDVGDEERIGVGEFVVGDERADDGETGERGVRWERSGGFIVVGGVIASSWMDEQRLRSNTQIRSAALSGNHGRAIREGSDSQRTFSEAIPRRETIETQGNGVMVVHRDETAEERMRRLKGKAPMTAEAPEKTPMSAEKGTPCGLLLRDRGIIRIRDAETPVLPQEPKYVPMDMRREDHGKSIEKSATTQTRGREDNNREATGSKPPVGAQIPDWKGSSKQSNRGGTPVKKRQPQSPLGKGTRASKKLNLPRGRPSSKVPKTAGTVKSSQAHDVPHIEVRSGPDWRGAPSYSKMEA